MEPVPKPTRDLTDEEFRVLSSPKVVEAMTARALELEEKSGLSRDAAMDRAIFEAEEELLRQRAVRGMASPEPAVWTPVQRGALRTVARVTPSKPKAFGATLGEMLANRGKK
jgi:hypothetical protein